MLEVQCVPLAESVGLVAVPLRCRGPRATATTRQQRAAARGSHQPSRLFRRPSEAFQPSKKSIRGCPTEMQLVGQLRFVSHE